MKLNQRIYDYAVEDKLIERQEISNDRSVEIYSLNEYEDIFTEFTNQGRFAVWSSVDGRNYRLYIEDGYYKKLAPLYKKNINEIWLDFWDECDASVRKFRNIVMPVMLLLLVVVFIFGFAVLGDYPKVQLGIALGVAALFMIFVLFFRRQINKRINKANAESVQKIKNIMGENKFAKYLEQQRSYIDEFFHYDDNTDNESTDEVEAVVEEAPQEENVETLNDTNTVESLEDNKNEE